MKTTLNFLTNHKVFDFVKTLNPKRFAFFSLFALVLFGCDPDNGIGLVDPSITKVNFTSEVQTQPETEMATTQAFIVNKKVRAVANLGDSRDECAGRGFCNVSFERPYLLDDRTVDIEIHLSGIDPSGRFQIERIVFPNLPQHIKDDYFANRQFEVATTFEKTVTVGGQTGIIIIETAMYAVFGSTEWFITPHN